MSLLCPTLRLLSFRTNIIIPLQYVVQVNNYAKIQAGVKVKVPVTGRSRSEAGYLSTKHVREKRLDTGTDPATVGGLGGKSKKKLKMGQVLEKKVLPVETDPHKLVNFVCGSNILKEGPDVEIKPDSEYPDWLWDIHTGPPKKLEELDPNSKEYWRKVKKAALRRNNLLAKLKPF